MGVLAQTQMTVCLSFPQTGVVQSIPTSQVSDSSTSVLSVQLPVKIRQKFAWLLHTDCKDMDLWEFFSKKEKLDKPSPKLNLPYLVTSTWHKRSLILCVDSLFEKTHSDRECWVHLSLCCIFCSSVCTFQSKNSASILIFSCLLLASTVDGDDIMPLAIIVSLRLYIITT